MKNMPRLKLFSVMTIFCLTLMSCAQTNYFNDMDRGLVNLPIMDFENYSDLSSVSPHTNLRGADQDTSSGCNVCAY